MTARTDSELRAMLSQRQGKKGWQESADLIRAELARRKEEKGK